MHKIDDVAKDDFCPSDQDILRARSKTTGIIETVFSVAKLNFRIVDVGGQRSERKKWIHCFQDVTAIIFCVSLIEYDMKLDEDRTTNRMMESLRLFAQIVNTKWFAETDIIMFLNKKDLFDEKIHKKPITETFPQYKGPPNDPVQSADFIRDLFKQQAEESKKEVYAHVTTATDTSNIVHVFNAVKDILLNNQVDEIGLN